MPKSPFVDFKAVKAAVSMEQVLQHYGLLDQFKRSGNGESLSGPCPIHKGTNPTQFRVSLTNNCWNCFSGCKGGNVLDFVAKMENIKLHAAALKLCEWFGLQTEQPPSSRDFLDRIRKLVAAKPPNQAIKKPKELAVVSDWAADHQHPLAIAQCDILGDPPEGFWFLRCGLVVLLTGFFRTAFQFCCNTLVSG